VGKKEKYAGVVVPMITPFDNNLDVDFNALTKLVDYFIDAGTIPFILGTTGESASMDFGARKQYVKRSVEFVNHRSMVYAGVSDTCLRNTLDQAQEFAEAGVDAFVVHPPAYYPLTANQVKEYFIHLAEHLPAPMMIYNIPSTTKISIPLDVIEELSHHPNIVGLKDSERSLERMQLLVKRFSQRADFSLLSGWTAQSARAILMGFDGIVPSTANLIPRIFTKLYHAAANKNFEEAEKIQKIITPIADFHQKDRVLSEVTALLKLMMNEFGLCKPYVLPPLTRFDSSEEKRLIQEMKKLNLTKLI
jgi:dihydrodipicolinate synthase/N-acetylneuraminate lyase